MLNESKLSRLRTSQLSKGKAKGKFFSKLDPPAEFCKGKPEKGKFGKGKLGKGKLSKDKFGKGKFGGWDSDVSEDDIEPEKGKFGKGKLGKGKLSKDKFGKGKFGGWDSDVSEDDIDDFINRFNQEFGVTKGKGLGEGESVQSLKKGKPGPGKKGIKGKPTLQGKPGDRQSPEEIKAMLDEFCTWEDVLMVVDRDGTPLRYADEQVAKWEEEDRMALEKGKFGKGFKGKGKGKGKFVKGKSNQSLEDLENGPDSEEVTLHMTDGSEHRQTIARPSSDDGSQEVWRELGIFGSSEKGALQLKGHATVGDALESVREERGIPKNRELVLVLMPSGEVLDEERRIALLPTDEELTLIL